MSVAWEWRISTNHWWTDRNGEPTFHAYDVNDLSACEPVWGLCKSVEDPNEGSHFCPKCFDVIREQPGGRPKRTNA